MTIFELASELGKALKNDEKLVRLADARKNYENDPDLQKMMVTTNFEQIELVVINSNERAKSLYKKFGFVEFGIFKNSFKYANGTYDDGIYMIKTLKK